MSMLAMLGFETRATARDRITVVLGAVTYSSTVPPGGSLRSLALAASTTIRRPWLRDGTSTPVEASGNLYWFGFNFQVGANGSSNDNRHFGCGRNGTEKITISMQDSTNNITLRINGAVVATSSSAVSLTTWKRIIVSVDHQTGGLVRVFIDGNLSSPIISYTLLSGDVTALAGKCNEFWLDGSGVSDLVDDMWAMDPADATGTIDINQLISISIEPGIMTGNGNYTAWTGTFADIDELPASDADFIEATAVGQAETFTHAGTTATRVHAVQVYARVTRTGTDAGSNIRLRMRHSSTDQDTGDLAAPGDGDITYIHQERVGGGAWNPSAYGATEFGFLSAT